MNLTEVKSKSRHLLKSQLSSLDFRPQHNTSYTWSFSLIQFRTVQHKIWSAQTSTKFCPVFEKLYSAVTDCLQMNES